MQEETPPKHQSHRYSGLKPPWKKGVKQKAGPGRPKRADVVEALRTTYCDNPANLKRLIRLAEKRHADMIFYYLGGKPIERIDLSGELKHTVDPNLIAAAKLSAQALRQKPV